MAESTSNRKSDHILSFLKPEICARLGRLPNVAIQGVFLDEERSPAQFQPNAAFIETMHHLIKKLGPGDPGLQQAAREQGTGYLYVIDGRTPDGPQGRVPPEDIIGAFQVENGVVVEGSYVPNADHRVFTENGPVQLPVPIQEALVDAAMKIE